MILSQDRIFAGRWTLPPIQRVKTRLSPFILCIYENHHSDYSSPNEKNKTITKNTLKSSFEVQVAWLARFDGEQ